jgi:hypothetical protein
MLQQPKTKTVRVLRPFKLNGEVTVKGTVMTLPLAFASEMVHAQKAEIVPDDAVTPAPVVQVMNPPLVDIPQEVTKPKKRGAA